MKNGFIFCEDDSLKLAHFSRTVNYGAELPFVRRPLPHGITKIARIDLEDTKMVDTRGDKDDTYACILREPIPMLLQHPPNQPLIISGGKYRPYKYSISLLKFKPNIDKNDIIELEEDEVATAIEFLKLKSASGPVQLLAVGISKVSIEGCESQIQSRIKFFRPESGLKLAATFIPSCEGGVTSIRNLNGNILASIGPRVLVFQYEDKTSNLRLLAEYEGKLYTTVLSSLANFIITGDYIRNISFLHYKEEYMEILRKKDLEILSVENSPHSVTAIEFWIDETRPEQKEIGILTCDSNSIVRIFVYNKEKKSLDLSAEINLSDTVSKFLRINPESQTIYYVTYEGSLGYLIPISDKAYKRLYTLNEFLIDALPVKGACSMRSFRRLAETTKNLIDLSLILRFRGLAEDFQTIIAHKIAATKEHVLDWLSSCLP